MNIKEAKQQIKNAIIAYRSRDEYGRPLIPAERQRPIFMTGAPGIGKTAIVEQLAQEMGLPLVTYSMTHHTRQSALGLPYITEAEYGGESFRVTNYTMSEIIASIYDRMRDTGIEEGLLFLDEINCVSETLAPAMLQFLQYKVFGQHRVPQGWIIITAGNPPEYNKSVRDFDMATLDRLKRIDIEADYETWREYALQSGVEQVVLSYLDVRKADFNSIETDIDGKRFATPRGWVDLSDMIHVCELNGIAVDEKLIAQYIQSPKIAKQFALYYDLYKKYRGDYQIEAILNGVATEPIMRRAREAAFDERVALIGLIMDGVRSRVEPAIRARTHTESALKVLQKLRRVIVVQKQPAAQAFDAEIAQMRDRMKKQAGASMLSRDDERAQRAVIAFLEESAAKIPDGAVGAKAFDAVQRIYDARVKEIEQLALNAGDALSNMLRFAEMVFGEGQEMVLIISELTANGDCARFIARYGCDEYYRHNKALLFYERQRGIMDELERLKVEEEVDPLDVGLEDF